MRVRPGQDGDRAFMRDVLRWTALETYPELGALGRLTLADRLDELFASYDRPGRRWWVAEDPEGGRSGGVWALVDNHPILEHLEAVLVAVAVAPEARGRGVGRAMLEAVRRDLGSEGVRHLRLFVRGGNSAARHLYESTGFVPRALEMELGPV